MPRQIFTLAAESELGHEINYRKEINSSRSDGHRGRVAHGQLE